MQSPGWIRVIVDSQNHILCGISANGGIYLNSLIEVPSIIRNAIENAIEGVINAMRVETSSLDERISAIESVFYLIEDNPEYIAIETDSEDKILGGRNTDGSKFENFPVEFKKTVSISGTTVDNVQDPENRLSLELDSTKKIISYRKKDGTKVEHSIETDVIKVGDLLLVNALELGDSAKATIEGVARVVTKVRDWNIPKYGVVNFNTEDFYVTANENVHSVSDLHIVQLLPDTGEIASEGVPISSYFVGETRLMQFAYGNCKLNDNDGKYYATTLIRKVNNVCYFVDTLGFVGSNLSDANKRKVIDGYSFEAPYDAELAENATKEIQVEVIPLTGPVEVSTWAVNKNDKHHIKGSVDFGDYYSENPCYLEVKYQGRSTLFKLRRNFRITFYKNSSYAKKNKVKIGELLRLSGYNLKSEYNDKSKIRELFNYRLILAIYQYREMYDRYPWYRKHTPMCGATGTINGFDVRININGEFYGVYYLGLKKDETNYMMDSDNRIDGNFIQSNGTHISQFWTTYYSDLYEDQMNDDIIQAETDLALRVFYEFINGGQIYLGADGIEYPASFLKDFDGTLYIRNTLGGIPDVNSVTATKIKKKDTYLGTDNLEYPESWLTEIEGVMYVTHTLSNQTVKEGSITATLEEDTEFTKENIPERMSVYDWIDYAIILQVLLVRDNTANNIILYSQADMKKWFPYFYDMDNSSPVDVIDEDGFHTEYGGGTTVADTHIWYDLKDIFWDEIINRYSELRSSVLSDGYVSALIESCDTIPEGDRILEKNKWGWDITDSIKDLKRTLLARLDWLDKNYFINTSKF